jgi:hypothetical protein
VYHPHVLPTYRHRHSLDVCVDKHASEIVSIHKSANTTCKVQHSQGTAQPSHGLVPFGVRTSTNSREYDPFGEVELQLGLELSYEQLEVEVAVKAIAPGV